MSNDTNDADASALRSDPLGRAVAGAESLGPKPLPTIGTIAREAFETMCRRHLGEEKPLETPWNGVNSALEGGLWPGLHALVSGTGAGKTQFAMQIAIHTAMAGRPAVYLGLELGKLDIVARATECLASLNKKKAKWSDLFCGRHPELPAIAETYLPVLESLPLHYEIAPPLAWPASRVGLIAEAHPGAFIVMDFLQLVGGAPGTDARHAMKEAAYALRAAARDKGCTVLAISSTARIGYATANGEDKANDDDPASFVGYGKESGDIEFACDTVMFLAAAEKYTAGAPYRKMRLALAKHRVGPPAFIDMRLVGGTRFEDEPMTERKALFI